MPLPLTVSCFSKVQIGFTFLVPAHPGSPGKRAVKRVCVSVCVCVMCYTVFNSGQLFDHGGPHQQLLSSVFPSVTLKFDS